MPWSMAQCRHLNPAPRSLLQCFLQNYNLAITLLHPHPDSLFSENWTEKLSVYSEKKTKKLNTLRIFFLNLIK